METTRVLFVDDDDSLRLTFPEILKNCGFEVRTVGTVAEALSEITTSPFNVLISDLNIGQPCDGFTVVSAMRRTQPDCINFIVTGFPAFESALRALQGQVDEYFVKPAKVQELIGLVQSRLREKQPQPATPLMRLSNLIRQHMDEICALELEKAKADPDISSLRLDDEEILYGLRDFLHEAANRLDLSDPGGLTDLASKSGRSYGLQRRSHGYEISMLLTDANILSGVIHNIVWSNLLLLDTSTLLLDLRRFDTALQFHMKHAVQAYWDASQGHLASSEELPT
ncbi:MAG: hypothetical protein CXZ00_04215 [Acidobacteria bacterium]|mgnify:CR=1 FL=1|nr:MAG: hypothetical protein CXZ00_04215 [Acidobacteriota bacterium]